MKRGRLLAGMETSVWLIRFYAERNTRQSDDAEKCEPHDPPLGFMSDKEHNEGGTVHGGGLPDDDGLGAQAAVPSRPTAQAGRGIGRPPDGSLAPVQLVDNLAKASKSFETCSKCIPNNWCYMLGLNGLESTKAPPSRRQGPGRGCGCRTSGA